MSAAPTRKVHWTEEDYLRMEADSPIKHEYLDGEIYAMAGAKSRHNAICHNMNALLYRLTTGGPCQGFTSDQRIHVPRAKKFYTYADGGVACGEWQISEKDGMSLLNPVLLFEVLSPSTCEYDRGTKLFLYRQIESLKDVLLIDPAAQRIEHHHRGLRGWKETKRRRGRLSVLGGVLNLEDIYRVPPGLPEE